MSKMACLCGGVIRNHLCPCPTEGWILRDQDQEAYDDAASRDIIAFFEAIQDGRRDAWTKTYLSRQYPENINNEEIVQDLISRSKRLFFLSVAECEQCGRLWVQHQPGVNAYRSYSPDEPGYAAVLRSGGEQPDQAEYVSGANAGPPASCK